MKIVVCLKQVPDTKDIKWTDKGTMIREGVESILNPYDEFALEYALKIKDKIQEAKITVISMGPIQAKELLRIAIARGADEAFLISDKKFSGADTLATSYTISSAIKKDMANLFKNTRQFTTLNETLTHGKRIYIEGLILQDAASSLYQRNHRQIHLSFRRLRRSENHRITQ